MNIDVTCVLSSRRRRTLFECVLSAGVCFFFSSRRRHTRFDCDWSSDVCSSDLLWRRLVDQTPSGVFHSPSWIQVLTDTYGWEASAYVILNDGGEPCAGIPFCRISDILGERIVALPFSDYCDPLVNDAHSWRFLIDHLLPEHCPITVRCLHN